MKLAFCDTNIVSLLSQEGRTDSFVGWLKQHGATPAISGQQLIELSRADRSASRVADFLAETGAVALTHDVLNKELQAYPGEVVAEELIAASEVTSGDWRKVLYGQAVQEADENERPFAEQMGDRHKLLRSNYELANSGKYELHQAADFAWKRAVQILAQYGHPFLETNKSKILRSAVVPLPSVNAVSWIVFVKYYVGRREPKQISDLGDLLFAQYFPYCEIIITERDLCSTLGIIAQLEETPVSAHVVSVRDLRREFAA